MNGASGKVETLRAFLRSPSPKNSFAGRNTLSRRLGGDRSENPSCVETGRRSLETVGDRHRELQQRWAGYPCKRFYKRFPEKLDHVAREPRQAAEWLARSNTEKYREADRRLGEAAARIAELERQWPEMQWLWNTLELGRHFVRLLAVNEGVALVLGLLGIPLVSALWGGDGGMLDSPVFRRGAFLALVLLLAPGSSLMLALMRPPQPK